jgi:hypothetical protein
MYIQLNLPESSSASDVKMAIEKLRRYEAPNIA